MEDLGSYPGYVDPELPNGPQQYWRTNLPRLEQIKAVIDPGDVFHNPQSVSPVGSTGRVAKLVLRKRAKLRYFLDKTLQKVSNSVSLAARFRRS